MSMKSRKSGSDGWALEPVVEWLFAEGRLLGSLDELTGQLGTLLHDAGAPIVRLRLSMRTLHPLTAAVSAVWERDGSGTQSTTATHGLESRPSFIGSPLEIVGQTGKAYRRRLTEELGEDDHVVLHEFKARGITDYIAMPMQFQDGAGAILALASDDAADFSGEDIGKFTAIAAYLAPVMEVFRLRSISIAVAEAYLGERTGQRVLAGQFTRGNIEKINSAILVSDIRDWTGINNRLSAEDALAQANLYFEICAETIEARGGEILKFIGDGFLAIFPSEGGEEGDAAACNRALAAARQALQTAEDRRTELLLHFGIGLHFGDVHYGNIGSPTRLDFTVMGQAVNIASRIEGLCSRFGRDLLFSREFAEQIEVPAMQIGQEVLKGDRRKRPIYSLA